MHKLEHAALSFLLLFTCWEFHLNGALSTYLFKISAGAELLLSLLQNFCTATKPMPVLHGSCSCLWFGWGKMHHLTVLRMFFIWFSEGCGELNFCYFCCSVMFLGKDLEKLKSYASWSYFKSRTYHSRQLSHSFCVTPLSYLASKIVFTFNITSVQFNCLLTSLKILFWNIISLYLQVSHILILLSCASPILFKFQFPSLASLREWTCTFWTTSSIHEILFPLKLDLRTILTLKLLYFPSRHVLNCFLSFRNSSENASFNVQRTS